MTGQRRTHRGQTHQAVQSGFNSLRSVIVLQQADGSDKLGQALGTVLLEDSGALIQVVLIKPWKRSLNSLECLIVLQQTDGSDKLGQALGTLLREDSGALMQRIHDEGDTCMNCDWAKINLSRSSKVPAPASPRTSWQRMHLASGRLSLNLLQNF